jgi:hypothetical protein
MTRSAKSSMTRSCRFSGGYNLIAVRPSRELIARLRAELGDAHFERLRAAATA